MPTQCRCVGKWTHVRQWNNDLGEKPSPKYTQSQKLPAEGKPPQTPTTCHLSHVARDPHEAVLILTDPWPNSEDNHLPLGPEAFPCPALLGQTTTKLAPAREEREGLWDTPPSTPTALLHLDSVCACGTRWLQSPPPAPPLQSSLAVKASSTQRNILPRNWEKVGAGAAALLHYSALSSECNYPKQSHKTQFTIPAAFWHPSLLAYR